MLRKVRIAGFLLLGFGLVYSLIGLDLSGFGVAAFGPFAGSIVHGYGFRMCNCGEPIVAVALPIMGVLLLASFLVPRRLAGGRIRGGLWILSWVFWGLSAVPAAVNASS